MNDQQQQHRRTCCQIQNVGNPIWPIRLNGCYGLFQRDAPYPTSEAGDDLQKPTNDPEGMVRESNKVPFQLAEDAMHLWKKE